MTVKRTSLRPYYMIDCDTCRWEIDGKSPALARKHAAATGHKVHVTMERTTIYEAEPPAGPSSTSNQSQEGRE